MRGPNASASQHSRRNLGSHAAVATVLECSATSRILRYTYWNLLLHFSMNVATLHFSQWKFVFWYASNFDQSFSFRNTLLCQVGRTLLDGVGYGFFGCAESEDISSAGWFNLRACATSLVLGSLCGLLCNFQIALQPRRARVQEKKNDLLRST